MALSETFQTAINNAKDVKKHVLDQQTAAITRAQNSQTHAQDRIAQIASLAAFLPTNDEMPKAPDRRFDLAYKLSSGHADDAIVSQVVSTVNSVATDLSQEFRLDKVTPAKAVSIREFSPSVSRLNIPDVPEPNALPGFPDAPDVNPVNLPDRPALNRPNMPDLVEIRIPEFAFDPLQPFTEASPEWAGSSVSTVLQWAETPYQPVLMDEEIAVIRRMWAGGTGLPAAVEQALWERAASREDTAISRDISAAATEFSGRGFTMPPGMLVNRIDAIRTEGALRKQGLGRDILVKITDTHIENLRFACTQALAAEQVMVGIWGQMAQRQFDAAKVQLDGELALLNANIAIYNAQQSAWRNAMELRRMDLEERAQDLQRMKLILDGEIAKGTINEQRVRVFSEMYKALQADVDIYRAEMEGAKVESDVQRLGIERFKAEVEAVGEAVKADKLRYDAYASRIQGEAAKAQMLQAQGAAYSAYVSGQVANAEIAIKNQQAEIATAELSLRAYTAAMEAKKAVISGALGIASARISSMQAETEKMAAEARIVTAGAELELKMHEGNIRTDIALYETEIRKYLAAQEHTLRIAGHQLEAAKAVAQAQSTLAAGAMAGISLSSSVSGGGAVSASAADNMNTSVKL